MADVKKYVSLDKLTKYDTKIKGLMDTKDAATLASAKSYADGLATNYDEAGAAATAEANAKAYADGKDAAIAEAKKAGTDAAAAAATADGKAVAAQSDVDALETYVGTIPETATATDIVGYVQEKTAGIATDTALEELTGRVAQAETDIDNIEKDYLKAADKTELEGKITTAQNAADAAQSHSEGVAGDLTEAVEALEGADEAQVERIAALEGTIVGLSGAMHFEGVKESLPTDVSGYEAGDVIIVGNKEYVFNDGAFVEFGDVSAQAEAITALTGRMDTAESDIDEAQADIIALEGAVATKAAQSALDEAIEALEGTDTGLGNRITALEGKFGEGEGSVEDMIADAKAEAIETAGTNADTKDEAILTAAKKYADDEDAKIETRVDALEAVDHEHANKALLDTYTQTEANLADAVAKKHEHANKEALDTVTAAKIAAWDAAEANAKAYTDTEVGKDRVRLDAVEAWQTNMVEVSEEEINALFPTA